MIKDYIKTAMRRQGVSQNGLAKMIGISGASLSAISSGKGAKDENIFAIARLAGESPEKVLAEFKIEAGELKPEDRSVWQRIAGHAAIFLIVATLALATTSTTVSNGLLSKAASGNYILCKIIQMFKNVLKPA